MAESYPISIIESADEPAITSTEGTFDVLYPEYELIACDFSFDPTDNHITAHYDDTGIGDGYIIDYDLYYEDYSVDTVSIYNATKINSMGQMSLGTEGDEWIQIIDSSSAVKNLFSCSQERINISSDIVSSYSIIDSSSSEIFSYLNEDYELFPYCICYNYPVEEIFELDEQDEPFGIYDYPNNVSLSNDISVNLDKITIRTGIDGIPIGIPSDNRKITTSRMYGDYYGSVFGVDDDYCSGYISVDDNLLIDFLYYNYDLELIDGSSAQVVPLEECIDNSLPGALAEASFTGNYCLVYGAELVYIPFSVGCSDVGDWEYDVIFVPVWALYTYSYDSISANTSCIYLNAITGELVSGGI